MKTLCTVFTLVALLSTFAVSQTPEQDWQRFRQAYPYHMQTLALSSVRADGSRTLVVSEPPPHMTLNDFEASAPDVLGQITTARHRIGVNGWVTDIVADLPAMSSQQLSYLVDALHRKLFKTAYKAYAISIPDSTVGVAHANLDLHVTSGDLWKSLIGDAPDLPAESWTAVRVVLLIGLVLGTSWLGKRLLRGRRIFRLVCLLPLSLAIGYVVVPNGGYVAPVYRLQRVPGGDPVSLRSILDQGTSGVFLSTNPGFVVWSFPRSSDLQKFRVHARMFSLDSDLLIGAVASDKQVAIIGRERVVPVEMLPPLRTETILQLASADTDELAQSYERKFMFAGRFDDTNDWAPIYLSDELIDTEYGSLLNITDQMLKSWSNHGEIKYTNFNYPDPSGYPFDGPIITELKVTELTFNWNTKGAGYVSKRDPYEVFALNRLGALPVDYLAKSNSDLQRAEDKAYTYFNRLNDPNLVRVVQYAGMYQIFRRFHVTATAPPLHHAKEILSLQPMVRDTINRIAAITDTTLDQMADDLKHDVDSESDDETLDEIRKVRDTVKEFLSEADQRQVDLLVSTLADPGVFRAEVRKSSHDESARAILALASAVAEVRQHLVGFDSPLNGVAAMSYFRESERTDDTWIRTPTIVVSHATGPLRYMVGGHNLDAAVTELRADPNLSAGQVRVGEENGSKVVYYSPADGERVPELVRSAGRYEEKTPEELKNLLDSEIKDIQPAERPIQEVLGFAGNERPSDLRGLQSAHVGAGGEASGWHPSVVGMSPDDISLIRAFDPRHSHSDRLTPFLITRNADGTYIVAGGNVRRVEAADLPSAIDAVTTGIRNGPDSAEVSLHFRGFGSRQAKGFVRSAELDLGESDLHPRLSTTVETEPATRMTTEELFAVSHEEYDFARAENPRIIAESITEDGLKQVDVEMKVPAVRSERPSLLVRIRLFFEQGFQMTADLLAKIHQVVFSITGDLNTISAGQAILSDLRAVHPGIKGIELRLGRQSKDVLLVHLHNQDRTELAACQPV
jgi:hypothetical protein